MTVRRRVEAYFRARPLLADALLAVILLGLVSVTAMPGAAVADAPGPALTLGWNVLGLVAVVLRRRWTWLAVVLAAAHDPLSGLIGVNTIGVSILVLTYTAASRLPVRQSLQALLLMWTPAVTVSVLTDRYSSVEPRLPYLTLVLFDVMVALVAFLAGRIVFTRRRYVAALVERARTAEQNQQALAAQAVEDERRRIARELHDMVAHHVSVMGILATGSRRLLRKDPDTADEALATIEETGRTALREMRRLLDVLRTEPDRAAGEPLAPQPNLAGLGGLAEQVREAGVAVSVRTSGEPGALDPGVALTVYRIVQEALTNVLKHGGPLATAEVRLDFGRVWLTVEIFDTGLGPSARRADTLGHGLVGMRERVALFGGTLRTGPRPGGGFRVYARIPIEEGIAS